MRRFVGMAVLAGLCVAPQGFAGEQPATPVVATAGKSLSFRADTRVEVDADGKLVKVHIAKDLPEGVRQYVARELATWRYVRRHREGMTGNAVTWITLGACAVPDANGGYAMGLEYHGHGPRLKDGTWHITQDAGNALLKSKFEGVLAVKFVVNADGTAKLGSLSGPINIEIADTIMPPIEYMVGLNSFEPEMIGGQPVATRATYWLDFKRGETRHKGEISIRADLKRSLQCASAVASGERLPAGTPITVEDSVLEIVPAF